MLHLLAGLKRIVPTDGSPSSPSARGAAVPSERSHKRSLQFSQHPALFECLSGTAISNSEWRSRLRLLPPASNWPRRCLGPGGAPRRGSPFRTPRQLDYIAATPSNASARISSCRR